MIFYGVPDIAHLDQWAALGIPFEYQDFMLPDILDQEEAVRSRVKAYLCLNRDRSGDVLHGPFLDIAVHSSDSRIRAVSSQRIRQACEIARTLEAKAIILHTNLTANFYLPSYRQGWIQRNEEFLSALLEDYPELTVYMENMFDEEPDCLVELARRMAGRRFGICLDIAHGHLSRTPVSQWLTQCGPYITHYHLNDNHGSADEHLPVGSGSIAWGEILPAIPMDATATVEVNSLEKYFRSIDLMKNNHT